jgi:hypothetical protein
MKLAAQKLPEKRCFEKALLHRLRKNSIRREAGVSTPAKSQRNQLEQF